MIIGAGVLALVFMFLFFGGTWEGVRIGLEILGAISVLKITYDVVSEELNRWQEKGKSGKTSEEIKKEYFEGDLLTNIYVCVVPSAEQAQSKVVYSTNPSEIDKTFSFPAMYKIFLVNDSNLDIVEGEYVTGGFNGEEDYVELNRLKKNLTKIDRKSPFLLEEVDFGMLDFVLWYQFSFKLSSGKQLKAQCSIGKAYALKDEILFYSPILSGTAYRFYLSDGRNVTN